jgi:Flp pilus assembly protein TadG
MTVIRCCDSRTDAVPERHGEPDEGEQHPRREVGERRLGRDGGVMLRSSTVRSRRTRRACRSSNRSCRHLLPRSPGSGERFRAVVGGHALDEAPQLLPQGDQSGDLFVDLRKVLPKQGGRWFARAFPGLAKGEQLPDIGQPQPQPLGALDEPKPVDSGVVVAAMVAGGARRSGQQPDALVVAHGVRAYPDTLGDLFDRQHVLGDFGAHTARLELGAHSKVKVGFRPAFGAGRPVATSTPVVVDEVWLVDGGGVALRGGDARPEHVARCTEGRHVVAGRPSRPRFDERGSVTLFAVVVVLGLLAMAGLVVDGGAKLTAQRRANNVAEQAARAGAQAADQAALRAGHTVLDPSRARLAALQYLSAAGHSAGRITVTGAALDVEVTASAPTAILGILGIHTLTVTGRGQARLLRGVYREQP